MSAPGRFVWKDGTSKPPFGGQFLTWKTMTDLFHNGSLWSKETSFSWIISGKKNAHWCWLSIQGAKKRRPKKTTLVLLQLLGGEEERHGLLEIARELKVMRSAWFGMMETHMKHHETISQIEYDNRNFLILDNQHGSSTSGGSSVSGVANGILL